MPGITRRTERTPQEAAALAARRDAAHTTKQRGPSKDAVPLGLVRQLRQLGSQLRHEREKQGLTQAELAAKIGMDEPAISRIEKGLNLNPTLDTLTRIAAGLGKGIAVELSDETVPASRG